MLVVLSFFNYLNIYVHVFLYEMASRLNSVYLYMLHEFYLLCGANSEVLVASSKIRVNVALTVRISHFIL